MTQTGTKPPHPVGVLGILAGLWLLVALPFITDAGCWCFPALFIVGTGFLLSITWPVVVFVCLSRIRTWTDIAWVLSTPAAGILGLLLARQE